MDVEHLFAGIPVADRDAAAGWYERLVGRPPDLLPNESEAAWQLTGGGSIYLLADTERAGSALHTLLVADIEAFIAEVGARGIPAGPIETIAGEVRHVVISDPDGNRLNIGQPPG